MYEQAAHPMRVFSTWLGPPQARKSSWGPYNEAPARSAPLLPRQHLLLHCSGALWTHRKDSEQVRRGLTAPGRSPGTARPAWRRLGVAAGRLSLCQKAADFVTATSARMVVFPNTHLKKGEEKAMHLRKVLKRHGDGVS